MPYMGNASLRSAGEEVEVTAEQMQEIIQCILSIEHFASNYCYINNLSHGRIPIPLYDFQKELLALMKGDTVEEDRYNIIIRSARQTGKCCCEKSNIKIRRKLENGEYEEYIVEIAKLFDC